MTATSLTEAEWERVFDLVDRGRRSPSAAYLEQLHADGIEERLLEKVAIELDLGEPPQRPDRHRRGERVGAQIQVRGHLCDSGTALVYLATHDDGTRIEPAALKMMRVPNEPDSRAALTEAWQREQLLLREFSGSGKVAPLLEAGEHHSSAGTFLYLCVAYKHGLNLVRFCQEYSLDVPARLNLLCQVCDAVASIHAHGLVHGDLKPDNIQVERHAGQSRAWLLDLGLTTVQGQPWHSQDCLTGSPGYMSPEQVSDHYGPVTEASDVYALGMMLFELLEERPWLERRGIDTAQALQLRMAQTPAPCLTKLPATALRAQLQSIVQRAAAYRATDRYAHVAALREALTAASVQTASTTSPKVLFTGRWRALFASVAVLIVLAAVAVGANRGQQSASLEQYDTGAIPIPIGTPRSPRQLYPAGTLTLPQFVKFPSNAGFLTAEEMRALQLRYDLFDMASNPIGKGVAHRYRQQVIADTVVISDMATGLMWQKNVSKYDYRFGETAKYIGELNRKRHAGYDDWRMPTAAEVGSLLQRERYDDRYHHPVFMLTWKTWSADVVVPGDDGWAIDFMKGRAEPYALPSEFPIRAVRSLTTVEYLAEPAAVSTDGTGRVMYLSDPRSLLDPDQLQALLVRHDLFDKYSNRAGKGVAHRYSQELVGDTAVVSDAVTGLMWQKHSPPAEYEFAEATAYIDTLNRTRFAGYDDWRLPAVLEAASLLQPEPIEDRYLDPILSGGTAIWTATFKVAEGNVWGVNFAEGRARGYSSKHRISLRAVRAL